MTLQQSSTISEIKLKLPKNAKLFFNEFKGLYYLVHYDHVILVLNNSNPKIVLSAYAGSPTSQKAIEDTLSIYHVEGITRYYSIHEVYKSLGKTPEQLKSDRKNHKGSETGIHWLPRMVKHEWSDRISALENYDWRKGNYLWQ